MIRLAKKGDIESILKLIKESVEFHRNFDKSSYVFNKKIERELQSALQSGLADKNRLLVVAENRKIVGYARASVDDSGRGYVGDIVVTADYRLRGIGKMLVAYMLRRFKKRNVFIISANVDPNNTSAIKFYEKLGFKKRSLTMSRELKSWLSFLLVLR